MSSKLKLFGLPMSPPVRAVLLTLGALELEYEYIDLDESKSVLKNNPQRTVPTLEDNGQTIWDSHAICAYLVRKYGKDDALYPKDFYRRAVVDQRLHYENGVLFMTGLRQTLSPLFRGPTPTKEELAENLKKFDELYELLEIFLADEDFMAGSSLTIADLSILSSVSSMVAAVPIDANRHPKLSGWLKRMQQLPYYEKANGKGVQILTDAVHAKMAAL